MTTFRSATKDDVELVSLCTMASTGLYDFSQQMPEDIHHSIIQLCSREDTLYSYTRTRVAVMDGVDAGAIVSYPGAFYQEGRRVTFGLMRDAMGMDFSDSDIECEPDEYYLDCLAVLPQFRGRGVGLDLIRDALKKALRDGYHKASCIVGADEPQLMKYYAQVGFQADKTLKVFGCDYVKMVNCNFPKQ